MNSTPLPLLPRKLAARTDKPAPSYIRCYKAILDGLIPAEKVGREWRVADSDLATAERVLGLSPEPARSAA